MRIFRSYVQAADSAVGHRNSEKMKNRTDDCKENCIFAKIIKVS